MAETGKVLIVDDEESMVITLEDILSVLGYEVLSASNGSQALELVKEEMVDVILMDFKMPGMNGVEAFRKIKKINSSVKVIFITAYYDEKILKEAMAEGLYALLHKPLDIPQLLDYIKAVKS